MDTAQPRDSERLFRRLFAAFLGLCAVAALLTFRDWGVTWDEEGQNSYGAMVARWYITFFHDKAALTFSNLYLYGGLFELMVQPVEGLARFAGLNIWEARHLMNMVAALLGVFFTWRLASLLGGARAGLLAAVFLVLTPVYVGHSANNPKDLPFAVAVVAAVDAIFRFGRDLPRPGWKRLFWTGAMLGLPLGIRIGGFFVIGYLGLVWLGNLMLAAGGVRAAWRRESARAVVPLLAVLGVAWIVMLVGWPWGQTSPLLNPLRGVLENVRFKWAGENFYDGKRMNVADFPWTYLPRWFSMVLPEFYLALPIAGLVALGARWGKAGGRRVLELSLLVVFALLPIVSAVVLHSTMYDGMRHFLFVVPLLAALAGLAVSALIEVPGLRNWVKVALLLPVVASCALTLADEVRLHPYQSAYFNRLGAGGVAQASKRFPTDYWHSAYREGVKWVAENYRPEQKTIRIRLCGPAFLANVYLDQPLARGRVQMGNDQTAELLFVGIHEPCGAGQGKLVHTIERMGMPLAEIRQVRP